MAYSSQRQVGAHPGPFLVLVGRVDSLPLKWKREKVSKEKAMPSDAEDVRPKACGEQHSPDRARGAHKLFRGGVGTDSSKGVRCHNPHSHANSALGLILLGTSAARHPGDFPSLLPQEPQVSLLCLYCCC